MVCARCSGRMVREDLLDEKSTRVGYEARRCLNCGHIEDAVILTNRVQPPSIPRSHPPRPVGAHRRRRMGDEEFADVEL
jgi:uncharacterized Zn finger protein